MRYTLGAVRPFSANRKMLKAKTIANAKIIDFFTCAPHYPLDTAAQKSMSKVCHGDVNLKRQSQARGGKPATETKQWACAAKLVGRPHAGRDNLQKVVIWIAKIERLAAIFPRFTKFDLDALGGEPLLPVA